MHRVLVTDADTPKALAIVRAIGREYEVWTAADSRFALASWSRYSHKHLSYGFDSIKDFPAWVISECRNNRIDVVITPEEATSFLLAREEREFRKHGIRITGMPIHALEVAMDKARTMQAAAEAGLSIPPTRVLEKPGDALQAAHDLGYPVVIKPRLSQYWTGDRFVGTDGVGYANSDKQLLNLMKTLDPRLPAPLIQRFIQGHGRGVHFLLANDGSCIAEFAHERLRDYRPTGSGSVLRKSIATDPQLREMSLRLLRHIGCSGVAMVEFRIDSKTNEPYLMEINGRFWGSLQLAIDSGVNFPALLVDHALGKPVSKPEYRSNVVLRWWIGDLIRTLRVLKGKPPGYIGEFPSRLSAVREFLGPQPEGTLNEILRRGDCWPSFVEPILLMRSVLR